MSSSPLPGPGTGMTSQEDEVLDLLAKELEVEILIHIR